MYVSGVFKASVLPRVLIAGLLVALLLGACRRTPAPSPIPPPSDTPTASATASRPTATAGVQPTPTVGQSPTAVIQGTVYPYPFPARPTVTPLGGYPAPRTAVPTPTSPYPAPTGGAPSVPTVTPYPPPGGATATPAPTTRPGYPPPGQVTPAPTARPGYPPPGAATPIPVTPLATSPTGQLTPPAAPTEVSAPTPTQGVVRTRLQATDPRTFEVISGQNQLVEFFSFSSPTSKSMAPVMYNLEDRYQDQIRFVYLDIDDPANSFYKSLMGSRPMPLFFLLDGQGNVIKEWVGYVSAEEFESVFATLGG